MTDDSVSRSRILRSLARLRAIVWSPQMVIPLGLAALVCVLYAPVVNFDFVNWDDPWYITWNDLIKSWHPVNLYGILTESVARNFAPLTIGTFLVEHTIWQLWPGGYHLTNVLLHAVNAVLVYQLVRQLTGRDALALTVAALFAVHPVQVEAVAWVSSRKTLLSSTFMLASLICWLRPQRTSRQEVWGNVWLVLALLSKASAVTLPLIVVAYDVLITRRKFSESFVRQVVPLFFCVLLILITMNSQVTIVGGVRGHIGMSKFQLFGINLTLLWMYVGMILWPRELCVLYDPPTQGIALQILCSAIGWGAVTAWLWRVRNSQPLLTFAGVAWILLFLPMLNLFPLTTLMNDRYLYLPCIPFFAMVAALLVAGWERLVQWTGRTSSFLKFSNALGGVVTALLVGYLGCQTAMYLPVWRNPESLWSYARVHAPTLAVVHIQWALTLEDLGRHQEAITALEYAREHCHPDAGDRKRIEQMLERCRTELASS